MQWEPSYAHSFNLFHKPIARQLVAFQVIKIKQSSGLFKAISLEDIDRRDILDLAPSSDWCEVTACNTLPYFVLNQRAVRSKHTSYLHNHI